jgi:hypothetical protein
MLGLTVTGGKDSSGFEWQDLHDGNKTCMQLSYWELILENGQWLGCWITDRLCALPVTGWTGIHGFGYFSPLIWIAPFSAHKLIRQDRLLMGYVHYRLPVELEFMDLDTFPIDSDCTLLCSQVDKTRYSSIASGNNCIVQLCKCVSLHL